MYSKITPNSRHSSTFRRYQTKPLHGSAVAYRAHDDDTTALFLAFTGVALMVVTVVSMLFAFRIL
jgi:hypothetical protein